MSFSDSQLHQPPAASALIESLRSMGYTLESAIADLIDNSITAGARRIWISYTHIPNSKQYRLIVQDDGCGMPPAQLLTAMRPGSNHPLAERTSEDLGRFGLGLKTASFSQCRCVTVASKAKGEQLHALRWDLEHVQRLDAWELLEGVEPALESEVLSLSQALKHGTWVIWTHLDRLQDERPEHIIHRIREHLSIVFHRFIDEDGLDIRTSLSSDFSTSYPIQAWDPYLRSNFATHIVSEEVLTEHCSLVGYVLPHRDRCSEAEWEQGGFGKGWLDLQGCYLYRSRRLLMWGGWMNLGKRWRKDPDTQLARIQIDFDNSEDLDWNINVMKSSARPPLAIRKKIQEIADKARKHSRVVFTHRGRRSHNRVQSIAQKHVPIWSQMDAMGEQAQFQLNREHPVLQKLCRENKLPELLRMIERSLPVSAIWFEHNKALGMEGWSSEPEHDLESIYRDLYDYVLFEVESNGASLQSVLHNVHTLEPFSEHPELIQRCASEVEQLLGAFEI